MFDATFSLPWVLFIGISAFIFGLWVGIKEQYKNQYLYKTFRLVASIALLGFMFLEQIILKPLRRIKIAILEKTIKRLNGYWTIGLLIFFKTIEGVCKIILPFVAAVPPLMILVIVIDGVLGFISMNLIIHGHENLQQFTWYVKFVAWLGRLRDELEKMEFYKRSKERVSKMRSRMKELWTAFMFKIFGNRRPKGILRYLRMAIYLRRKRNKANAT